LLTLLPAAMAVSPLLAMRPALLLSVPPAAMRVASVPVWMILPPWLLRAPASSVICRAEVLPPSWLNSPRMSATRAPLPVISPRAPL